MPDARRPDDVPSAAPGAPVAAIARAWAVGLGAVLLLALGLRLLYLRQFGALPIFDQPIGDSAAHLRRAAEIAHGRLLPAQPFYYCSIFYPYFLALVLGVLHGSLFTVALVQVLAGVATVAVLAVVARGLFGTAAGLATGALAALYGPAAYFEADLLGVAGGQLALALALLGCAWWLIERGGGRARRVATLFGTGLALGFAIVERPNLLVVACAVLAWIFAVARAERLRACGAAAAGVALPLALVLALNVAGTGQWVPLTTSGGINLSLAYHDGADGTYDEPWEREAPEFSARHIEPEEAMTAWASRKLGRPVTTQEASAYWSRQALAWIGAHPAAAAGITLRKAALLLNAAEVPNHLDFAFLRERAPALRLMPVGFGALFALAAIGCVAAWSAFRARAAAALLLAFAGGAWASVIPFTVADRYRAPMTPALLVLAGAGVAYLLALARGAAPRRDRAAATALAAAAAALVVSHVPLMRPLRGRDEWMFAQAYEARGQMPQAVAAYEAAVRAEPGNGELLNNLANAYRRLGQRDRAEAVLRQAIRAEPGLAYPHKSLGMLLVTEGRFDAASAELEAARGIDSSDVEVVATLGAIHAEQGDRAAARLEFARARRLAPNDPRLARLIAHYEPDQAASR